jgi:hypothetical protein
MRSLRYLALVSGILSACGGNPAAPDAAHDAAIDAAPPPWWHPRPGQVRDWDLQLGPPFDVSAPRAMYDLDLWALVPAATTLDYGDGAPVTVPAGALAGKVAELHARTPAAIVICHVDTGAWEPGRPDAAKFPGHEASPPDRPTPPKPGSVIGWSTDRPGERVLDLRTASRGVFAPIIWKRLDLAKQIGCDGVLPDRNDMASSNPGFAVTVADQNSWYHEVATQAHQRLLSVGMKDAYELPSQADDLAPLYDWMVPQRCAEYQDCDQTRPFLNLGKAVLAIDYQLDGMGGGIDPTIGCSRQTTAGILDGLIKDAALTSAYRVACAP